MLKLLDIFLENSFILFYVVALIVALIKYPNYFDTPLKYYPILLIYTFINELLGYLIKIDFGFNPIFSEKFLENNVVFYNVYNFIFFLFFLYVFRSFIISELHKKIVLILAFGFILVSIANLFSQNFLLTSQVYAYSFGGLSLIYSIIIYLRENSGILRRKIAKLSLLFWIGIGLLIFHLGYIPIKIYYSFSNFADIELYYNIRRIHLSLVGLMYCFIIYGFIQMKGKFKIRQ
jgi:hypothetical protein